MNKPFIFERADTCPLCKSERSIEAYNKYDKPMRLSNRIDCNQTEELRSMTIKYMRCSRCREVFFPTWHGQTPYACIDNTLEDFMSSFSAYKKVDP